MILECQGCQWRGLEVDIVHKYPDIPGFAQRVVPGEKVPYGECATCGALVHESDDQSELQVTLVHPQHASTAPPWSQEDRGVEAAGTLDDGTCLFATDDSFNEQGDER